MVYRWHWGLWLAALSLVGCDNQPAAPPEVVPDAAVVPREAWCGQAVSVIGKGVGTAPGGLHLAERPLPELFRSADSVLVQLPPYPCGDLTISRLIGGHYLPIAYLTAHGYRTTRLGSTGLNWDMMAWPEGSITILGVTLDRELGLLNPATGFVRTFPQVRFGQDVRGPNPTDDPSLVVIGKGLGVPAELWRPLPVPEQAGTAPFAGFRHLARLSPSVWLQTAHHCSLTYNTALPAPYTVVNGCWEEPHGIQFSTAIHRATFRVNSAYPDGVPVFDTQTGQVAYRVPALEDSRGIAFSDGGDTLYLGGAVTIGGLSAPTRVVALDAVSGQTHATFDLDPAFAMVALALDPQRPYVYVAGTRLGPTPLADMPPEILVLDRRTLQPVIRLDLPPEAAAAGAVCTFVSRCFGALITVDPTLSVLYLVDGHNVRARIHEFSLPPVH